ncbi:hypothetical protein O3M35_009604 [Rhynocoris fuscipes]|uniref:Uncharacterized protein n=1 Tax=Rhynocoris fuscipes TaxID=488301 RepID=A0AAW1D506_9HEMI
MYMYRKGTFNNSNESLSEYETHGRISKTPRLIINKLNIPLDSVVLVKGDTVTLVNESSKDLSTKSHNIIDITTSDDDLSNDVIFQNMVIKRFQSNDEKSKLNQSQASDKLDCDQTSSSSSFEKQSGKKYYSYGPKSRRKLLPHPKTIKKKIKPMSTTMGEEKKSEKHLLFESDDCFSATESAVSEQNENSNIDGKMDDIEDQLNESKIVSKTNSYLLSPLKTKNISIDRKNGNNSNKKTIDKDVAEIIAILEDSPVEGDENEKHDISENTSTTTQPEFTPSRTSQRIKNKKVKFSALRLLAGGDIPNTKKKVPTNSIKKTSTPKKSLVKTKANSTADINANNSDLSTIVSEELSSLNKVMNENTEENEDSFDRIKLNKCSPHKPVKQYTHVKKMLATKNKLTENTEKVSQPTEKLTVSSPSKEKETNDLNSINNKKKNKINENRTNGSEEILQKSSLDRENIEIKEGSNKIRVELQGTAQKKIVNITISPKKSLLRHEGMQKDNVKEKKDIELGPDIIIRKVVKSGKKQEIEKTVTTANDENDKTIPKNDNIPSTKTEKSINVVSDVFQNNLIIKNLIYPEKTTKSGIKPIQEVEVPPQIKKFIQETVKNKKPNENSNDSTVSNQKTSTVNKAKKKSELNRKKYETKNKQKVRRMQSSDEEDSDRELELNDTSEPDNSDIQIINNTLDDDDDDEEDDRTTVGDSSTDKITKKSNAESKKHSKEEILSTNVTRVGGKKTAKVMPLRQVKLPLKSDLIKKSSNDKFKPINEKDITVTKTKTTPRLSSPTELSIGGKRNYKNAFEKYFICTERIYEHNDSLDSDSSSDDDTLFSHFIDLRRRNKSNKEIIDETVIIENNEEILNQPENSSEQINIEDNSVISELGEVLKGIIATDLPKWTCHTLPENSVICLLLLERETNGTYDVKKSIEIDANFNANIYVDKKLVNEYCGIYDSYESIKNLIYQVELL